ncbi:MAG: glycosyltransferase [Candidatus Omnitrophica bacterium]|nr:glycosyltransferase [Candidatus Omnitrophota bacterium]
MRADRQIKVAHVINSLSVGGMEKVVSDIIKRYDKRRIFSTVYCAESEGEYAEGLKEQGIEVRLVNNNRYPLEFAFRLVGIFQREKIDVVHSYSGIYRDATLAGVLAGVKVLMHTDQGKFYPDTRWTRLNHRFFSLFRDKIIAVSDELKEFLSKEVGIDPEKITRIYNAVDVGDYPVGIDAVKKKNEIGIKPEIMVIGMIARLVPVKDHLTLFKAFKEVKKTFHNVKLLVAGDGPLRGALEKAAIQMCGAGEIIFLGNRSDVSELLRIMDIVCLSSLSEGLSLVLAEAMASGVPIVATNVGGNAELVVDGSTGFLVPPGEVESMAEAILELLNGEAKRKEMGERGRERVVNDFNILNTVDSIERIYYDLADKKGIM